MGSPTNTVNYEFLPNQDVYVIDKCNGNTFVHAGEVIRVRIEILVTATTIKYDVRLNGEIGTKVFNESDIYADKTSALTAYETKIS